MKILITACLLGTTLWAGKVETLVSNLQRFDLCLESALTKIGEKYEKKLTPDQAISRIQEHCTPEDIELLSKHMACMAQNTCDWLQDLEALDSLNNLPRLQECPKPTSSTSEACTEVFDL